MFPTFCLWKILWWNHYHMAGVLFRNCYKAYLLVMKW